MAEPDLDIPPSEASTSEPVAEPGNLAFLNIRILTVADLRDAIARRSPPPPREYSCEDNWLRDVWIFEQKLIDHDRTWKDIGDELVEKHGQEWTILESPQSFRDAIKRVTEYLEMPMLEPTKPGRPPRRRSKSPS